ncbi:MAG: Holliday junction branch migration protein RuvA [Trueperaceae bacterium]
MIAFVDGVIDEVREGSLVVRAGSFGVEVLAPTATLARAAVGDTVRLRTHLALREDAWTLYGFADGDDLTLFRLLLGTSGVGPKLALAVLSALPRQAIVTAVTDDDPALLAAAPGVGKRTAERIVVELRSRLPDHLAAGVAEDASGVPRSPLGVAGQDAVVALTQLGFRDAAVKAAVADLVAATPDNDAEMLIRKALAKLR